MPETTGRRFYHNWISYAGTVLAVLAFISFVFLLMFHSLGGAVHAPYGGLVTFIVVPAFLILGLLFIPLGMVFEWWRWKRHKPPSIGAYPKIDLNLPRHRRVLGFISIVTLILVFLSVFGSYKTYQYTESVAFCGTLCHGVMQPEYVSHEVSPHARVRCVDCHVGPGAEGFFQSKLQGTVQLYEIVTRMVPRPIPVPVSVLRPVRVACEQCHWPAKFFGAEELKTVHYLPDKQNTEWDITLLLKVGGGGPWNPQAKGIHWHVGPHTRIEYIATDRQSQIIPWVRYTDLETGKALVYTMQKGSFSGSIKASGVRTMDCVDCHDRPTHIYNSPSFLMNSAMAAGYVDPSLPDVKRLGVQLLAAKYDSQQAATVAIATGVEFYYRKNYPRIAEAKAPAIARAVNKLQVIYRENFFPYMKVRWDTYVDNIGHLNSLGCYRCHDGLHKTSGGEMIGRECTKCHTIIEQGTPGKMAYSVGPEGLTFQHPENIGGVWQMLDCNQCHTGATP
jgi:NapC/NirT cytochrome c family, N-terminal region